MSKYLISWRKFIHLPLIEREYFVSITIVAWETVYVTRTSIAAVWLSPVQSRFLRT